MTYRDVLILDPENKHQFIFNLTEHDLSVAENREALKTRFLEAAAAVDSDDDQLPDAWERIYLGNLDAHGAHDSDGDGADNFREFAFCSEPNDARSKPELMPIMEIKNQQRFLSIKVRRPSGNLLSYFAQASSDLMNLRQESIQLAPSNPPRNLFDGSGAAETKFSLSIEGLPRQFVTVAAEAR